jgi:hypothetical protein
MQQQQRCAGYLFLNKNQVEHCPRPVHTKGLCSMHLQLAKVFPNVREKPKGMKICDSDCKTNHRDIREKLVTHAVNQQHRFNQTHDNLNQTHVTLSVLTQLMESKKGRS